MSYVVTAWSHKYKGVTSLLTILPGTCNIMFSSNVVVPMAERGKGLGKEAHRNRLIFAAYQGCQQLFCFVQRDNIPQIRILSSFGWEILEDRVGRDEMLLCVINIHKWCEDNKLMSIREQEPHVQQCEHEYVVLRSKE